MQPLMNFQLPQPGDGFDSYGNSSQDDSASSQGTHLSILFPALLCLVVELHL